MSHFRLPKPIGSTKTFTWGPVVKVHSIEDLNIDIVEYHPMIFEGCAGTGRYETEETQFHPYVKQKDTSRSCHSLPAALIYAIAQNQFESERSRGSEEARIACKILNVVT